VSWSGGAVAWPVVVAGLGAGNLVAVPLAVLAAVTGAMALRLVLARRSAETAAGGSAVPNPLGRAHHAGASVRPHPVPATRTAPGGSPATGLFAIFAALLFFYAGGESAIGGWVAEHVRRIETTATTRYWTFSPMVFWAALALGRLLTPLMLRAFDESRVLLAALTVLLGASTVLAVAPSVPTALVAAAVAGLGLAPVFPITFVDLSRTLAPLRPRAVGPAYAMASVGSAVLPWLVGVCSTRVGTLRAGLVVPIVSAAAMLALTGIRLTRRRQARAAHQEGDAITHTPQ
jgi:FHS family glucose/mannose:H+ symporter-like MFS transporter